MLQRIRGTENIQVLTLFYAATCGFCMAASRQPCCAIRGANRMLLHADVWWSLCTIGLMCRCVSETISAGVPQIEYEDILLVSTRLVFCPALHDATPRHVILFES